MAMLSRGRIRRELKKRLGWVPKFLQKTLRRQDTIRKCLDGCGMVTICLRSLGNQDASKINAAVQKLVRVWKKWVAIVPHYSGNTE